MISYSRKQKMFKELTELNEIAEQKRKEQDKQKAVEIFRAQTADIHTTQEQSLEDIKQWCGNETSIEKLHDFIDSYYVLIAFIFTVIINIIFMFLVVHINSILDVIATVILFGLLSICIFCILALYFLELIESLENKIQKLIDKIKEKTLDVHYSISENTIDCPIEIKKEILHKLNIGYVYVKTDLESKRQYRTFSYITEDGEVDTYDTGAGTIYNHERCDNLYYSKEFFYFENQLKDDTMYKISDIITDRGVR